MKGKIEGKLEIARRFLAQDIDMEFIAGVTELSLNQIKLVLYCLTNDQPYIILT